MNPPLIVLSRLRRTHGAPEGRAELPKLTLPFDDRRKSRARVRLDDGREAALSLARGTILRDGDRLASDDGTEVLVSAAPEEVSTGRSSDAHTLMRACYHLGNRHVPLQIGPSFVRYQHDHVLDRLARELGLEVTVERAPFEPEGGGYATGHSHSHGDTDHDHHVHGDLHHDHSHHHDRDHGHAHQRRR